MATFHITENGFSMTDDTVAVPECYIEADGFLEASQILNEYLSTKIKSDKIKLVTPENRIAFQ